MRIDQVKLDAEMSKAEAKLAGLKARPVPQANDDRHRHWVAIGAALTAVLEARNPGSRWQVSESAIASLEAGYQKGIADERKAQKNQRDMLANYYQATRCLQGRALADAVHAAMNTKEQK